MNRFLTALVVSGAVTTSAQVTDPGAASQELHGTRVVRTLTGCITSDDGGARFTLSDIKRGTFELTGSDVRPYLGQRVQVKGASSARLHVTGGLWPTPNVAAQAGAIDPIQAAIAAMPGGTARGTRSEPILEFRVEGIRSVKGGCS
jgi:hypothetical protein